MLVALQDVCADLAAPSSLLLAGTMVFSLNAIDQSMPARAPASNNVPDQRSSIWVEHRKSNNGPTKNYNVCWKTPYSVKDQIRLSVMRVSNNETPKWNKERGHYYIHILPSPSTARRIESGIRDAFPALPQMVIPADLASEVPKPLNYLTFAGVIQAFDPQLNAHPITNGVMILGNSFACKHILIDHEFKWLKTGNNTMGLDDFTRRRLCLSRLDRARGMGRIEPHRNQP